METELLRRLLETRIRTQPASDLLFAKTKREVEAKISSITLTKENFFELIDSAPLLGFEYEKRTFDYMMSEKPRPREVKPDVAILREIKYLESRKKVIVHVFRNSSVWNAFYFTYADVQNNNDHFKGGSHIHFVNHLWGNQMTLDSVLKELSERSFTVSGSHIATDFDQ